MCVDLWWTIQIYIRAMGAGRARGSRGQEVAGKPGGPGESGSPRGAKGPGNLKAELLLNPMMLYNSKFFRRPVQAC